jgi:hypothetical protein
MMARFNLKQFILITLIASLWINASEVLRYFAFVMPSLRQSLAAIEGVAPMNWGVFAIWGGWDTLLTVLLVFMVWLFGQQYGYSLWSALIAGTVSWSFFFVLFWVGMVNMGLADCSLAGIALPWSWVELVVPSVIAMKLFGQGAHQTTR